LNQEIAKAADGNDAALGKFQELGISIRDAGGQVKSTETLMKELADRFAQLPDGAEKSALAVQLFGRSGAQLLPLLNGGAEGIKNLGDEATRLGIVFTKEQAVIAEGMNDALEALQAGVRGTRAQIGILFAPTITEAARALQKVIEDNRVAITDFVRGGIERATPIITDFVNAILGNDADVQNIWVLKAKLEFLRFAFAVENAVKQIIIPAYELIIGAANRVAEAINGIFGTTFTGQQIIVAAAIAKLIGLFGVVAAVVQVVITSFAALKSAFGFIALITQSGFAFSLLAGAIKGVAAALVAVIGLPGLLVAALAGIAVILYRNWDAIAEGGRAAWELVKRVWDAAPQFFSSLFANAGQFVAQQFTAIGQTIGAVWETIKQGGQAAIDGIKAAFTGAGEFLNTVFIAAANAVAEALQGIATSAAQIWNDVRDTATQAIAGLAEAARDLWAGIATSARDQLAGLVAVFQNLNANLNQVWQAISRGAASVFTFLRDGFVSVVNFVGNLFDGLANRIERVWARIKSIVDAARSALSIGGEASSSSSGGSTGTVRRAGGGIVRGPGTATSDSILARLSDGEFVIRAAAVRKYGPQLLAAINSMRFKMPKFATGGMVKAAPLPAFKMGGMVQMPALPQFNLGGLVDSLTHGMVYQVPAFADGGMVPAQAQGQGRPVTIVMPDGRTFEGLTASDKTAEELSRYATNRRLRSAGRKPGWVG
jgi:phage-related protein